MDWDHLRFVLATRREGSALGAARALGVNQTTVVRRIEQAERELGIALFERRSSGLVPTKFGICVADAAEVVEACVLDLQNAIEAEHRALGGTVRLTTSEVLADRLVVPALPAFKRMNKTVRVVLITDDRQLNIARGEADIALRAGSRPEGAGIVIRRLPSAAWSLYCSRSYLAEHGSPTSREEIKKHAIVALDGAIARVPPVRWLIESAPDAEISVRSNSLTSLLSNLRAGLGIAMLPCHVGDRDPALLRCFPPPPELDAEMWLIVREEVKSAPHVRALADFLFKRLHEMREELAGGPREDHVRPEEYEGAQ
jgi:DNA-binding transcriptional LysR family regulator